MRRWTWLLAVVGLVVACGGMHEDGPHSEGPDERLVSTEWLSDHKDDDNVVVVDTQPTDQYMSGHIPGAVSASFSPEEYESHGQDVSYGGGLDLFSDRDADIPFQDGPPEQIQDAARSLGINRDSTVIAYDHGPDFRAARFLFTLHSHGFADVRILNGGFTKWTAEERPTTEEVPEVERGDFVAEQLNEETIATTDYVAATREDDGVKLISGLLPSWHYGGDLPYSRPGHIPNTVHIPMGYFFNSDGTWKDPSSIRPLFEVM
ncbi:MAG: sulfurtransferase, partial [Persicimonas sp.]